MKTRTAIKIVTCKSRFSRSWSHVMQARARLKNHPDFFFGELTHEAFIKFHPKTP